jgi:hypothetical protein
MTVEEIRSFRNANPFRPFDIVMLDGKVIRVELPIRIALSPSGRLVSVFEGSDLSVLNVSRIAALRKRSDQEEASSSAS